jgi:hypothetical protein
MLPSKESMLLHNKIFYDKVSEIYETSKEPVKVVAKFMGGELFHRADMKELYEGFDDTIEVLKMLNNKYETFKINPQDSHNIIVASNLLYKDLTLLEYFTTKLLENNFQII